MTERHYDNAVLRWVTTMAVAAEFFSASCRSYDRPTPVSSPTPIVKEREETIEEQLKRDAELGIRRHMNGSVLLKGLHSMSDLSRQRPEESERIVREKGSLSGSYIFVASETAFNLTTNYYPEKGGAMFSYFGSFKTSQVDSLKNVVKVTDITWLSKENAMNVASFFFALPVDLIWELHYDGSDRTYDSPFNRRSLAGRTEPTAVSGRTSGSDFSVVITWRNEAWLIVHEPLSFYPQNTKRVF